MHIYSDLGKDKNEDTVIHEYIYDTFKKTFKILIIIQFDIFFINL